MALMVLVAEIMISRLDGLADLVLHSMDLLSVSRTTIIAQQVRSLVSTVLIGALAATMTSRLAGQSTTEFGRYYTEIANNSLLFFATVSKCRTD
jgi:hypothetical protein